MTSNRLVLYCGLTSTLALLWLAMFLTACLGLVYLAALPGVLDYILYLRRRSTMLLHLRLDLVYGCFAIFLVAVIAGAAWRLRGLAGAGWRREI